jgi:hypothetical protein
VWNKKGILPRKQLCTNLHHLTEYLFLMGLLQANNRSSVKYASNVSQASIGLHQAAVYEAASGSHLVTKGVKAQRQVGFWLFGCSAWVFSMVIIGGVTRLTKSGLSMTDWKFMGSFPPMTPSEWQAEFEKYQQSPEYKR